jgi:hypothetical protein
MSLLNVLEALMQQPRAVFATRLEMTIALSNLIPWLHKHLVFSLGRNPRKDHAPPAALPLNISMFLELSLKLDKEALSTLWGVLKDTLWAIPAPQDGLSMPDDLLVHFVTHGVPNSISE